MRRILLDYFVVIGGFDILDGECFENRPGGEWFRDHCLGGQDVLVKSEGTRSTYTSREKLSQTAFGHTTCTTQGKEDVWRQVIFMQCQMTVIYGDHLLSM